MRYVILFLLATAIFSCNKKTREKGDVVWKSNSNGKYYGCGNDSLMKNAPSSGKYNCGIVAGNGEVPTEFIFQYNESADIEKIEADLKVNYPQMQVETCSCNPRLRKYSSFPVYEIGKSGEELAVKNTGGHSDGPNILIPNVLNFAPNYILVKDTLGGDLRAIIKYRSDKLAPTLESEVYASNNSTPKLKVAILDTGYGMNSALSENPDLLGLDCPYFKNTHDNDPELHGTMVTNLILNQLGDKRGQIKVVPVKVLDSKGKGTLFDLICVLSSLKDRKVDVINMSLGFYAPKEDSTSSRLLASFVEGTKSLIFTAAGNAIAEMDLLDGTNSRDLSERNLQFFPACLPGVTRMASITSCIKKSTGNNKFAVCERQNYSTDFVNAAVEMNTDCRVILPGGYSLRGTSFATPIAAGKAIKVLLDKSLDASTITVSSLLDDIANSATSEWTPSQVKENRTITLVPGSM